MPSSCDHVQSPWKNLKITALEAENLAVHHDVYGLVEIEFDAPNACTRHTGMLYVRAGKQSRKQPKQSQAPDGRPPHVFDQTIGWVGFGRDHHLAAGEFAIAKGEKQAGAAFPFARIVEAMREDSMLKPSKAGENTENVTELTPFLETAVRQFGNIRRKAEAEQIQEVDFTLRVAKADHIAGAAITVFESFDGVLDAARGEIAKKRISGSQREKRQ
jgi:hypothetical protein